MEQKTNPLILVFYVDKEMFIQQSASQPPMVTYLSESVDKIFDKKEMNALAFFLPTNTEERVECINPAIVPQDAMDKINQIMKDIQEQFSIVGKFDDTNVL